MVDESKPTTMQKKKQWMIQQASVKDKIDNFLVEYLERAHIHTPRATQKRTIKCHSPRYKNNENGLKTFISLYICS